MEFTITCPIDGPVEVGLEDIETVVLRDSDRADIAFVCPHCGAQVTVTAIVPAFLLAAIEALAEDPELTQGSGIEVMAVETTDAVQIVVEDDSRTDAYCEYFRRQLSSIECVDDAVAEMDSPARS
jgi:hypothetical protein